MKPFPWKCAHCRQRAVYPATIAPYGREMEHDGRKYQVSLSSLDVPQCAHCGEIVLDDAANGRITDALRATVGLLFPTEIRQKREALGLTQKQVANALSVSEFSVSRWENGAQLQQRVIDKFLRLFFDLKAARNYLGVEAPRCGGQSVPNHGTPGRIASSSRRAAVHD